MTIDVHAHCIPSDVLETLEREGDRYGMEIVSDGDRRHIMVAGRVSTGPMRTDLVDVDRRLAKMDAAGVDVQMISSFVDLTAYVLDPATGARFSRMFNEGLAGLADDHAGRFLPLCTVPLQAPAAAAVELRFAVGD